MNYWPIARLALYTYLMMNIQNQWWSLLFLLAACGTLLKMSEWWQDADPHFEVIRVEVPDNKENDKDDKPK